MLAQLSLKDPSTWDESISLLSQSNLISTNNKSISIILLGDIPENEILLISNKFNESFKEKNITFVDNLLKAKESDIQIVLTRTGLISKSQLLKFKKVLLLQENSTAGLIILDDNFD